MKCFLSHSSSDKAHYVRLVAQKLRPQMTVLDEISFEEGMQTSSEILKGLDSSDIFVLFISDAALDSEWVKREILEAYDRLSRGDLDRIYPLIIDPKVTHVDARIPEWMRNEYNLRLVSRPNAAARRIEQRLRELSWKKHPRIREKEKIFVGRNELIKAFEERVDDISQPTPICIFAAGLRKIGRRALLRHVLTKTNTIDASYDPLRIYLSQDDGIEGFILKTYDLGIAQEHDISGLLTKTLSQKTELATAISREIANAKDIVVIEDDGSIVDYGGGVAPWFLQILSDLKLSKILFAVASTFRAQRQQIWENSAIFSLNVPELDPTERTGLLKRYTELEGVDLGRADLEFVGGLLQGYPDQVFYAVDLLKSAGINFVRNNANEVVEFNKNRAAVVLRKYEAQPEAVDLIRLLAEFEFISYKLIHDVIGNDPVVRLIDRFVLEAICEEVGAAREYVRVNDIVRDYILRNRLQLASKYARLLKQRTAIYLKSNAIEDGDASEYLYYVKEALSSGLYVDERYLIPAHFLLTLRQAYDEGRYPEVVNLCDRILQKARFLEKRIENDVRYYLCQSLARQRSTRFLEEVQKIDGSEHHFLLGFYYRLRGRYKEAVERQLKAMGAPRSERRARRELGQNYVMMEDYDRALSIARDNYKRFPTNSFLVQAYFNCLVQQPKSDENKAEALSLIAQLDSQPTEQSREMAASARAQFVAVYESDEEKALQIIEDAIATYSNNNYPILTKMDIAVRFSNKGALKDCLVRLRKESQQGSIFYNAYRRSEAVFLALDGNVPRAIALVETDMPNYSEAAKARLLERLHSLSSKV